MTNDSKPTRGSAVFASRMDCFTSIEITVYVKISNVHRMSVFVVALYERRQALIEQALH